MGPPLRTNLSAIAALYQVSAVPYLSAIAALYQVSAVPYIQWGLNFFVLDSTRVLVGTPSAKGAGRKTHLESTFCAILIDDV